jgi:hypothetical protein
MDLPILARMANTLDSASSIQSIVARAANDIAQQIVLAVRREIASEVGRGRGPAEVPAPVKRKPGRPAKVAVAAATAAAVKRGRRKKAAVAPKAKPSKFVRRSPEQIQKDNARLLAFIKKHPGLRSEEIENTLKMPKPNLAAGLKALRSAKKLKMKGVKRAATYGAA